MNNRQSETKIYIDNYNPNKITPNILLKLEDLHKFTKTFVQLFSSSGIFIIQNNKIIKQIPNDKPLKKIIFEGIKGKINMILDESFFKEEQVLSQIPITHHSKLITKFYYCQGEKSKLYLVIEGYYKSKIDDESYKKKYTNFVVENVYFLVNDEIDNYLIKKEINVFLSLLI
jgi:hypothetical protein